MNTKKTAILSVIIVMSLILKMVNFTNYPLSLFVYGVFYPLLDKRVQWYFELLIHYEFSKAIISLVPVVSSVLINTGYQKGFGFWVTLMVGLLQIRLSLAVWCSLLEKIGFYNRIRGLNI